MARGVDTRVPRLTAMIAAQARLRKSRDPIVRHAAGESTNGALDRASGARAWRARGAALRFRRRPIAREVCVRGAMLDTLGARSVAFRVPRRRSQEVRQ